MYTLHPSLELQQQFAQKPFQGAAPESAHFLFVGLDANYAATVEQGPSFNSILEYHEDGVAFWQRHGVHHPFLLPHYRGDGRRYHRNFSRVGFTPAHAHLISFVELLHLPTVGRNQLSPEDFDAGHLQALDALIRRGHAQHVFLSAGVVRLMRLTGAFAWLPKQPIAHAALPVLHREGGRTVHQHLHFSNYGKFQQQLEAEALAIRSFLPA